ncbi:hydroxyacid dehydrogenase [Acidaminobacter sp. JC074]|uniref:NAD(P)-dependent oxidoreductase n=1 Tax=Acidaminobacter sp. JC074 TaxID=2530199 RepID=UPI001F0DCA81|nr:NAD(P)-dependent oxidoreductase [Acidaminobacter sp. JC074]MCH4890445.1 hydroxyacid dehydrogenase [Acidaminobacter sp. JC074]
MKIVIMESLGISQEDLNKLIQNTNHEFTVYNEKTFDDEEQLERAKDADALIIANTPLSAYVINKCPNLKMISVAFVGVDHVATKACNERNILVSNAAEYCTYAVAELAIGLTLSVLRNIPRCDLRTRKNQTKDGLIGHELYKKTFGIIGAGAIGAATARIAKAFGCDVIYHSRTKKPSLEEMGIKYVSFEEILKTSDILSLHTPLTSNTKGMIDKKAIDMMKTSAVLINTARGPIVDNAYLAEALKAGRLAGAGIDVFDIEPPLDKDPLSEIETAVLTPHVAYATKESIFRRAQIVFDNIESWCQDKPQNVMN